MQNYWDGRGWRLRLRAGRGGDHMTEMNLGTCPFPDCPEPVIPFNYPKTLLRRELSGGWVVLARRKGLAGSTPWRWRSTPAGSRTRRASRARSEEGQGSRPWNDGTTRTTVRRT